MWLQPELRSTQNLQLGHCFICTFFAIVMNCLSCSAMLSHWLFSSQLRVGWSSVLQARQQLLRQATQLYRLMLPQMEKTASQPGVGHHLVFYACFSTQLWKINWLYLSFKSLGRSYTSSYSGTSTLQSSSGHSRGKSFACIFQLAQCTKQEEWKMWPQVSRQRESLSMLQRHTGHYPRIYLYTGSYLLKMMFVSRYSLSRASSSRYFPIYGASLSLIYLSYSRKTE